MEVELITCKECKGNGYVRGKLNTGTCIFCRGSGHTNKDSRTTEHDWQLILQMCEDFVYDNEKKFKTH